MMYIVSAIISAICGIAFASLFYIGSAGNKKFRKITAVCTSVAISILCFMCFIG